MKTFEEACLSTFARALHPDSTSEQDEAAYQEIIDDSPRWASIAEDIKISRTSQVYIDAVFEMVRAGVMTPKNALSTCFIQGCIVGVEMERQELPVLKDS